MQWKVEIYFGIDWKVENIDQRNGLNTRDFLWFIWKPFYDSLSFPRWSHNFHYKNPKKRQSIRPKMLEILWFLWHFCDVFWLILGSKYVILSLCWDSSSCWLEQRTHNPLVLCSTHRSPTKVSQNKYQVKNRRMQDINYTTRSGTRSLEELGP